MEKDKDSTIGRIISFVEKERVGILGALTVIFVLAYLRSYLECRVFEYLGETLYLRANHIALYFAMFIIGVVLITIASGIKSRTVFNVVLFGWPIILVPPIIDYMMGHSGLGHVYPYYNSPNFIKAFLMFFDIKRMSEIGLGEFIQLWGIIILSSIYVFLKKRSILRSFLTGFVLLLLMAYVNVSMAYLIDIKISNMPTNMPNIVFLNFWKSPIDPKYYSYLMQIVKQGVHPDFWEYLSFNFYQQLNLFVALYYLVLFLAFAGIYIYIDNKKRFKEFIKMSDPPFLFIIGLLTFIGVLANKTLYIEYFMHDIYIGFALVSALAGAQMWTMLENLSKEWNAVTFNKKQYRNVAIAFSILALASSYLLGTGPFILSILFIATAFFYNCKPFTARDTAIAPLSFSLSGLLGFLIGFYTPSYWLIVISGPSPSVYDQTMVREIHIPAMHIFDITATILLGISIVIGLLYYILTIKKYNKNNKL